VGFFRKQKKKMYVCSEFFLQDLSDPDLVNASRIKRIARGSGWTEHEVKELLKNYKNSKNMMKASKGRQMQGVLRRMGLG
jgi:signal recognition particle subunit SRP54